MRAVYKCATLLMVGFAGFQFGSCSSGGNNCFPAGTKVQTLSGEVNIESIKIGDEVLGYDFATGKVTPVHVTRTYVHHHDATLISIALPELPTIEITPEHPLFSVSRNTWITAGALAAGEQIQQLSTKDKVASVVISSVSEHANTADVFNFETDVTGNYFVGGVLAKYY